MCSQPLWGEEKLCNRSVQGRLQKSHKLSNKIEDEYSANSSCSEDYRDAKVLIKWGIQAIGMQFTYNYKKISSKWYLIYSITEQKMDLSTEQQIVCALLGLGKQLPLPVTRTKWGLAALMGLKPDSAPCWASAPAHDSLFELSNVLAQHWLHQTETIMLWVVLKGKKIRIPLPFDTELRMFFSCTGWQTSGPAFLTAPWVGAYWHMSCLTKWSELIADKHLLTWISDDGLDPSKAVEWAWGHGCKSKNKKAKRTTWNEGSWANPEHPVRSSLPKSIMTMIVYPCFGSQHTCRLVLTVTISFSQEGNFPIILLRNDTMVSP